MPKVASEVRPPSWEGTEPERMLLERSKLASEVSPLNSVGTEPVSWLPERSKLVRAVRLNISERMPPERELSERSSVVRALSWPTWAGSRPETLMPLMSKPVTLSATEETVTPCQLIAKRCEAEPVPQVRRKLSERLLLAAVAARAFWMATRAWQSSTRSLLVPPTWGWVAWLTKVPSVQPEASRLAVLPTFKEIWAEWVSPPEEVMRVVKLAVPAFAVALTANSQLLPVCVTEVSLAWMAEGSPQVKVKWLSEA